MGANTVGGGFAETNYGAKLASFPLTNEKAKAKKAEPLLQKLGYIHVHNIIFTALNQSSLRRAITAP